MSNDNLIKELKQIIEDVKKDILTKQYELDILMFKMEEN